MKALKIKSVSKYYYLLAIEAYLNKNFTHMEIAYCGTTDLWMHITNASTGEIRAWDHYTAIPINNMKRRIKRWFKTDLIKGGD